MLVQVHEKTFKMGAVDVVFGAWPPSMRLAVRLKALPQVVSSASSRPSRSASVSARRDPSRVCPEATTDRRASPFVRRATRVRHRTRTDVSARDSPGWASRTRLAVRPRTRATPMAATKRNAASKDASSAEPDMEDLFAKHPGVRSAIERAPEARQALLESGTTRTIVCCRGGETSTRGTASRPTRGWARRGR